MYYRTYVLLKKRAAEHRKLYQPIQTLTGDRLGWIMAGEILSPFRN